MKIEIKDNKLQIDVSALLEELKGEDLIDLADALSCTDAVIKNVADQIIHGYTELDSSGYTGGEPPHTPLDKAVAEISVSVDNIQARRIRRLESLLVSKTEQSEEHSKWAFAMYHAWNDVQMGKNVKFPADFNNFRRK